MSDQTTSNQSGNSTEEHATGGSPKTLRGWTLGIAALLAVIVLIGALMLGGFFSADDQGRKLNSDNRTANRPAEP